MIKLIDYKDNQLWRGTIFRFKGSYPFEEIVGFMLVDIPCVESGFGLVCISGYYAGTLECYLPKEAKNENARSISTSWIRDNWIKWIYSECSVYDVHILETGER